jgi:hypothetical protein
LLAGSLFEAYIDPSAQSTDIATILQANPASGFFFPKFLPKGDGTFYFASLTVCHHLFNENSIPGTTAKDTDAIYAIEGLTHPEGSMQVVEIPFALFEPVSNKAIRYFPMSQVIKIDSKENCWPPSSPQIRRRNSCAWLV